MDVVEIHYFSLNEGGGHFDRHCCLLSHASVVTNTDLDVQTKINWYKTYVFCI